MKCSTTALGVLFLIIAQGSIAEDATFGSFVDKAKSLFQDTGQLVVTTDVPDANVFVDGKLSAMTDTTRTASFEAPAGSRALAIFKEQGDWIYEAERQVFVGKNSVMRINLDTTRRPTARKMRADFDLKFHELANQLSQLTREILHDTSETMLLGASKTVLQDVQKCYAEHPESVSAADRQRAASLYHEFESGENDGMRNLQFVRAPEYKKLLASLEAMGSGLAFCLGNKKPNRRTNSESAPRASC